MFKPYTILLCSASICFSHTKASLTEEIESNNNRIATLKESIHKEKQKKKEYKRSIRKRKKEKIKLQQNVDEANRLIEKMKNESNNNEATNQPNSPPKIDNMPLPKSTDTSLPREKITLLSVCLIIGFLASENLKKQRSSKIA